MVDINCDGLAGTVSQLPATCHATQHLVDVTDANALNALHDDVLAQHDGIDLLICSAGIAAGGAFVEHSAADIDRIVHINVLGTIQLCHLWLPHLLSREEAHIVTFSSMVGFMGLPGNAMYATTKFAIRGFSEALWAELGGTSVGLTIAHPGAVKTNIMKAATFTRAEEQAQLVEMMNRFAMPPEKVVRRILTAVRREQFRVTIGAESFALRVAERWFPRAALSVIRRLFQRREQGS